VTGRPEPGRAGENVTEKTCRLAQKDGFPFVCAGCGDCCRGRRDLVLSGYDLYRIARRVSLPPHVAANAFCRAYLAPQTCLPALCLTPDPVTGNCRFLEGGACLIHPARPLACALYPLGQSIDPDNAMVEYYAQTPLCGAAAERQTVADYLKNAGVTQRQGVDVRWAVECTRLSERLRAAGGREHPHFLPASRRIARALYYDYTIRDEFYPQFQKNMADLWPILEKIL